MPLEYWHEDVFDGIANSFGELLSIDPITVAKKRLTYARICVGVVEGQDMPQVIEFQSHLGRRVHQIDYENVPFACFHCKKVGHKVKACPIFGENEKASKAQNKQAKNKEGAPRKVWKEKVIEGKNPGGEANGGNDKREPPKENDIMEGINELEKMEHQKKLSTNNNRVLINVPSSNSPLLENDGEAIIAGAGKYSIKENTKMEISCVPDSQNGPIVEMLGQPFLQDSNFSSNKGVSPATVNRFLERFSATTPGHLS